MALLVKFTTSPNKMFRLISLLKTFWRLKSCSIKRNFQKHRRDMELWWLSCQSWFQDIFINALVASTLSFHVAIGFQLFRLGFCLVDFFFLMELLYHSTWTKTKPLFIFLFSIHVTCLFISLHQAGLNGSSFLVLTNKYYISSCLNIIPDWQISYLSLSAQFFHLPLFSQLRFSKKLSHKDSILLLIIVTQYTNINGHLCSPFNNLL